MQTAADKAAHLARIAAALMAMSDEEDAAITAAAEADPDSLPRGDLPASGLKPATEVAPDIVKRAAKA